MRSRLLLSERNEETGTGTFFCCASGFNMLLAPTRSLCAHPPTHPTAQELWRAFHLLPALRSLLPESAEGQSPPAGWCLSRWSPASRCSPVQRSEEHTSELQSLTN